MPTSSLCRPGFSPLLLVFTLLLFQALPAHAKESGPPVRITTAKVELRQMATSAEVVGTLQAAERAAIAAKVTGVITRMPVGLGSVVKTGDLLVAISAEESAARVTQAEAQLAQARRNLEREQHLLQKNAATPDTVKSMQEQFNIAQAALREAKSLLGQATITAPFDGLVTRKFVTSGDLATPGHILLQIENHRKLQVSTAAPESLAPHLHPGDLLTVAIPAAQAEVTGTLAEVAPAADPASRTTPIIIDLPLAPDLRTGQFARVRLPGRTEQALLVPTSAVVPSGQMDRVFVLEGDQVRLRLVCTGRVHGDTIEILAGVHPGETVATGNNRLLVDGQKVQVSP